jgi:putative ABC transport system permease protein
VRLAFGGNRDLEISLLLFIILRLIKIRFLESIMVIVAIALGVSVIAAVFSVMISFKKSLWENVNRRTMREIYVENHGANDNPDLPLVKTYQKSQDLFYLDPQDIENVKRECPDVQYGYITNYHEFGASDDPFKNDEARLSRDIMLQQKAIGCYEVTADYFDANQLKLDSGFFFAKLDFISENPVIILGSALKNRFYKNGRALGNAIQLNGKSYKIIGFLSASNQKQTNGETIEDVVFIPISLLDSTRPAKGYDKIIYTVKDVEKLKSAMQQLKLFYSGRYGNDRVTISSSIGWIHNQISATDPIFKLVSFFAASCLLIATINILNLMIARVIRRSKNLGLLMALGSSKRQIKKIFFYESILLCFFGSLLGTVFSFGITFLVQRIITSQNIQNVPKVQITLPILTISVFITIFISAIFGLYPAYKASRINAAEVLKSN